MDGSTFIAGVDKTRIELGPNSLPSSLGIITSLQVFKEKKINRVREDPSPGDPIWLSRSFVKK